MSDSGMSSRVNLLDRWFLSHPASINETYFQHMRFAFGFAFWLIVAGLAAVTHAIVPALCETTASRILRKLTDAMAVRH